MAIPQSTLFDLCDWNVRAASTSSAGDRTLTDMTTGLQQVAQTENTVAIDEYLWAGADAEQAQGPVVRRAGFRLLGMAIPESFTFEFDLLLTPNLPKSFENPNNRLFIAAVNQQGATAGLLFSYQGIAVAAAPDDPSPTPLGGSASLLVDEKGALHTSITVRISVDAPAGFMSIMLAPTALAYDPQTGGTVWADSPDLVLQYTVPLRSTTLQIGEGVILQATACSADKLKELYTNYTGPGQGVLAGVGSLRLATGVIPLSIRPTAVASAAAQVMAGRPFVLRGIDSYSPIGNPLSFNWEIEASPDGSTAVLEGATASVLEVGADLLVRYRTPTSISNAFSVVVEEQAGIEFPLHVSFASGVLRILLEMQFDNLGNLVPRTTGEDVVASFNSSFSPAYCPDVAEAFQVGVGSSGGSTPLTPGIYLFAGGAAGAGSTLPSPRFIPDLPGRYRFTLVVDDGIRPSVKAAVTVLAQMTEQLMGHRPNADYIFQNVSDFWNLVPDRAQLSTVWSATMQVISAEMLAAMQSDHSKTLRDISRRYQRRWLNYSTVATPAQDATLVIPGKRGILGVTVPTVLQGYGSAIATVDGTFDAEPILAGTRVLLRNSVEPPKIIPVSKTSNVPGTTNAWRLHADAPQFTQYRLVGSSTSGHFVPDPTDPSVLESVLFTSHNLSMSQFDVNRDVVRVDLGGGTIVVRAVEVNPVKGPPGQLARMENTLQLLKSVGSPPQSESIGAQPVDDRVFAWEHLRRAHGSHVTVTPYFQYPPATDLQEFKILLGDLAAVEVTDPGTGVAQVIHLPVVAVDSGTVFVQWATLLTQLSVLSPGGPAGDGSTPWGLEDLPTWSTRLRGFVRTQRVPGFTELVSVPYLGSTVEAKLFENTDYGVDQGDVQFRDWLSGTGIVVAGSEDVTLVSVQMHSDFPVDPTIEALQSAGADVLVLGEGDAGTYRIVGRPAVNKFTLDRAVLIGGRYPVRVPRFHYRAIPDALLWAEVSHFDNYKMIEGRFGLYVGMPRSLLVDAPRADYLSVVRSLWFAYLSGPTLHNMRLPIQAFLGLPFAEADGQITHIEEATPQQPGQVVVVSTAGVTYTYSYPYGVDLGINPRSGRKFRAAPLDLAGGIPEQDDWLADARIERFTSLVEVVEVADYISNPDLLDRELRGQDLTRRYHTFMVDVPLRVAQSTRTFPLIRSFLQEAKSAHTNYILVGSFACVDDIEVTDVLNVHATIMLHDGLGTAPFTAPKASVGPQGQGAIALAVENKLWPAEGVSAAFPVGSFPARQLTTTPTQLGEVKERYEAGYVEGVLDNYSGDGSLNRHLARVDQVNRFDVGGIDVCRSFLWVRCTIDASGTEFVVGERIRLTTASLPATELSTIWATSPPVVVYVGAGHNPHLPGVQPPQLQHPDTYVLLGFHYEPVVTGEFAVGDGSLTYLQPDTAAWGAVVDLGTEDRLDALGVGAALQSGIANTAIEGMVSGARATPLDALTRSDPAHAPYFLLERMFRLDKAQDYGPEDEVNITATTYIPMTGMLRSAYKLDNPSVVDPAYRRAVQARPYRPAVSADEQFVPSVGPGLFLDSDLTGLTPDVGGGPATDLNYKVRWGYVDQGPIDSIVGGVPLLSFAADGTVPFVKNVHLGLTTRSLKWWQYSQGFTQWRAPTPSIWRVRSFVGGPYGVPGILRIEGHAFVAVDQTGTPSGGGTVWDNLDGDVGGVWVFLRLHGTGTLIPALAVDFKTGIGGIGDTVLWLDATAQTQTGLALEVTPPVLADGVYDVVVRQYRRFAGDGGVPYVDQVAAKSAATLLVVWTATYGTSPYVP